MPVATILFLSVLWIVSTATGLSTAQTTSRQIVRSNFDLMGTFVDIRVAVPSGETAGAQRALDRARTAMMELVNIVSSWVPRSDTSRVNELAGRTPVRVDPVLLNLLLRARAVSKASGGAFDVTFSPLGQLWNFRDPAPRLPDQSAVAKALKHVGWSNLILDTTAGTAFLQTEGMRIDLGGIAKGAVIDEAARSLCAGGITGALINAGGDMFAVGAKPTGPWVVGVRDPRGGENAYLGTIALRDRAVATSGDYENTSVIDGKRYHHIIDPRTGWPAEGCMSVTVLAADAETADAWSTAFFVLGPVEGLALCERLDGIEAFFIDSNGKQIRSSGFPEWKERMRNP